MTGKNKSATEAQRERTARMRAKVGAKPMALDTVATVDPDQTVIVGFHSWEEKNNAPSETWFRCCKCERAYQRKDVVDADGVLLCPFQCGAGFLPHGDDWDWIRDEGIFDLGEAPAIPIYGEFYG